MKAMADAIWGGATIGVQIGKDKTFDLHCIAKSYIKKIKKEGLYTECRKKEFKKR